MEFLELGEEEDIPKRARTIHIVLDQACGLGCPGCYQENKSNVLLKNISPDTKERNEDILSNILDEPLNEVTHRYFRSKKRMAPEDYWTLDLFGGEPFMHLNQIEFILRYLFERPQLLRLFGKITIPTSGGKNGKLWHKGMELINDLYHLLRTVNPKLDLIVSLSYDGTQNKKLRNLGSKDVMDMYRVYDKKRYIIDKPRFISTVIPSRVEDLYEDYFVTETLHIFEVTERAPTFTFSHSIPPTSEYLEIFKRNVGLYYKFFAKEIARINQGHQLNQLNNSPKLIPEIFNKVPKLFLDQIEKLINPRDKMYNWCGAGETHRSFIGSTNELGYTSSSCEYLTENNHKDMLDGVHGTCTDCDLVEYCQRPCLKNLEAKEIKLGLFAHQCTLRKLLIRETKEFLEEYPETIGYFLEYSK